jgi:hypothetical protein
MADSLCKQARTIKLDLVGSLLLRSLQAKVLIFNETNLFQTNSRSIDKSLGTIAQQRLRHTHPFPPRSQSNLDISTTKISLFKLKKNLPN